MSKPVRVLLVEDEPNWQAGISALLATNPRFELVAVADHYESALLAYQDERPEVVLLDWQILGKKDGLEFGCFLTSENFPPERVVLISGANPGDIPKHPFLYVPKKQLSEDLLPLLISITLD